MTGTVIRPGEGLTPGYWKNHADAFKAATGYSHGASYEAVFDVDVTGTPTLGDALSAKGGGEGALLRASTAALANANSLYYSFEYTPSLQIGVTEVFKLDPTASNYFDLWVAAKHQVQPTLYAIDLDDDFLLSVDEIIWAVQDVYDDIDAITDNFSPSDAGAVALALDVMNNMSSHLLD